MAEGEALVLGCQEAPAGLCGGSWVAEGGQLESPIGQMEGCSWPPACTLLCFFPCSISHRVMGSRHQGYSSRLRAVISDYEPDCPIISSLSCEIQVHSNAAIKSSAPSCLNGSGRSGTVRPLSPPSLAGSWSSCCQNHCKSM